MSTVQELIKARKAVNGKYRSLQSDIASSALELKTKFKPITQPLKELISKQSIKEEVITPKKEYHSTPIKKQEYEDEDTIKQHPRPVKLTFPKSPSLNISNIPKEDTFISDPISDEDYSDDISTEQSRLKEESLRGVSEAGINEYLDQYTGLPREYIEDMFRDTNGRDSDHTYGIRWHPKNEKFTIGNLPVKFRPN